MQTLTYLWEIDQARKINPEGVFASMSMNNLYMETAAEFTKAYRILNKVIKAGGKESMLNGAERTMLLWQLSEELEVLNKKLRSLALSVCIYNFEDVWNRAIAGKSKNKWYDSLRCHQATWQGHETSGKILSYEARTQTMVPIKCMS